MDEPKSQGQKIQENLFYKPLNAWEKISEEERKNAYDFCEGYKKFIDAGKTEREFTSEVEKLALQNGYISIESVIKNNTKLKAGMKVYQVIRKKSVVLAIIGSKPLTEGVNIVGSHIDSPRIDLKQNPVYEDTDFALLKTHYYGGIKKYQWLSIPLAIHGVIIKSNGESVDIVIGEDESDPIFVITDLLPHLAQDQMQKKMSDAISGEGLNILIGSMPYNDDKVKEKVKLNILNILNQKYGIVEEDFQSAELEIIPAHKAKDVGFDRSLIAAYGQDDRVCAYTSIKAIFEMGTPEKTAICLLTDKEEIGSMGNTGAQSSILENFLAYICSCSIDNYSDLSLRICLDNSSMLSSDVSAGVDPNYEGVQDKKNASYLGKGIAITKYTGTRGKSGSNDANAEYVGKIRKLFNDNNIIWQTGELGKVDQGGGGTIALYAANLGIDVIDCGVPLLSMHAPYEIASKIDIYITFKGYKAFYNMK